MMAMLTPVEQALFDVELLAGLPARGYQIEQFCPNRVIGHAVTRVSYGARLIGVMDHGVSESLNISMVTTIGVGDLVDMYRWPPLSSYYVYLADFGLYGLADLTWLRPTITVNVTRAYVLDRLVALTLGLDDAERRKATASQPDATT